MTNRRKSNRPPGSRSTAFTFVAALAMLVASRSAPAADAQKFGGYWQLNLNESETLQQKLDAMHASGAWSGPPGGGWHGGMGGGPPMGGMGHGGYGGHGGHGGYGGGGEHGGGRDSTRSHAMQELARPPMSLMIETGDNAVVLSERGRTLEVLVLGDAAGAGTSVEPDSPHTQAHWKGKHLIAEKTGPRGTITQDYELSDNDKKLVVRTKVEGHEGRPPLELKRVYDRSDGEAEAPPPPAEPQPLSPTPPDSTKH